MSNGPRNPRQAALEAAGGRRPLDGRSGEALRLLKSGRNVVLYGPPGTGKTHAALAVREWWLTQHGADSVILATFHPSYAYEDFVEGFRPSEDDPSQFVLEDGVLLEAAARAKGKHVLLVIDEINRGDVARIFGEMITYIEQDKRNIPFRTAQRKDREREIPAGLHLLGTMNTADKSISLLDVALRRRFTFVPFPPDPAAFDGIVGWKREVLGVPIADVLRAINQRLLDVGVERDRLVGHAVLAVPQEADERAFFDRLRYDLVPLVEEYLFNDADRVARVLPGLVDADGTVVSALGRDVLEALRGERADVGTTTRDGDHDPSDAGTNAGEDRGGTAGSDAEDPYALADQGEGDGEDEADG